MCHVPPASGVAPRRLATPHPRRSMAEPHSHPLLDRVLERAEEDAAFRAALLADPGPALRDAFGVSLPPGYRVRFVEKPADVDALIVLPDPRRPGGELDDDELDQAAGGDGGDPPPPDGDPW